MGLLASKSVMVDGDHLKQQEREGEREREREGERERERERGREREREKSNKYNNNNNRTCITYIFSGINNLSQKTICHFLIF